VVNHYSIGKSRSRRYITQHGEIHLVKMVKNKDGEIHLVKVGISIRSFQ
jgi:hypothetical protein